MVPAQSRRSRNLRQLLKRRLEPATRIAVLAVGSDLRGDDAAGLLVGRELAALRWPRRRPLKVFFGETAPENLTGELRRYGPSHLLVVDAADRKARAGTIHVTDIGSAGASTVYCTHNLPLSVMLGYLARSMSVDIVVLGIQPLRLDFGTTPSAAAKRAVKQLTAAVHAALVAD
jgi:hydrogenase 3 maturation protease